MAKPVPRIDRGQQLKDVERALINAVMFEAGILPLESTKNDMRRVMNELDPGEARVIKRKFRKLWRKAARIQATKGTGEGKTSVVRDRRREQLDAQLGVGKSTPSRQEMNARKKLVFDALWKGTISPLLEQFESCDRVGIPRPVGGDVIVPE